jgi:DNA-binding transcriptional regulator YiaG
MAKTTSAEWAKRVERWQDSGLTAKEFAAELNVNAGTLSYWKYKLRKLTAPAELCEVVNSARTVMMSLCQS